MRRTITSVLAILLILAGTVVVGATPAHADADCSDSWHYIKHAQLNRYVKPVGESESLYATGVRTADYWNQQFLFCRDPGWAPNHYAIYSNATANYWGRHTAQPFLPVHAGAVAIFNPYQLFEVKSYDGHFVTIVSVAATPLQAYVYAESGSAVLSANRGLFLGGDNLFLIESPALMA
jgi:hypothetical protein